MYRIFAINPGSTSTKIALFENENKVFSSNVSHNSSTLAQFDSITDQLPYRKETILKILEENKISLEGIDAFVGRGGGLLPLEGGTYEIDSLILEHAAKGANGVTHPAQLGSLIADNFRMEFGGKSYVVNPPDVDEYEDIARITGCKNIYRKSHIHSLNHKETAIRHANSIGKEYNDCNFIVCHVGGGVSIAAHKKGRMVDGMDNIEGEGAMAPTRMGPVPAAPLIRLCYSGKFTEKEMLSKCTESGGFVDQLGTADGLEVCRRADSGDEYARIVWHAMLYQLAKTIGSMAAVLKGEVDGILLCGGMARDKELIEKIKEYCSFIAPITIYAGEFEMEAMANGAIRVLSGKEQAKRYTGSPVFTTVSCVS